MGLFGFNTRAAEEEPTEDELTAGPVVRTVTVTKNEAMAIPAFSSCIDTISGTVASLPVKLYRRDGERVYELEGDRRVSLLNGDTGDTLTGPEMKRAVVEDYYCSSVGGNIFVNRQRNEVQSLHYVDCGSVQPLVGSNYDPIFKESGILVQGRTYFPWQFVRILHATRDGRFGRSIVSANQEALAVAYTTMRYEQSLVSRDGNKRGFLQSTRKLGNQALAALRKAWRKFYGNADESMIVLNDGVTFQEAATTSTEMQLNENKKTNSADICGIFKMPPSIVRGGGTDNASKNDRDNYVRYCIIPLLADFKAALDRSLLLEDEKATCFFDFDLTELTKADMKERWESWAVAKKNGFMKPDEVRRRENLPPLGLDYISLGLQDVLFDTSSNKIIVPNMGRVIDLDNLSAVESYPIQPPEGGEQDEGNAEE